jgi:hypothetical protein
LLKRKIKNVWMCTEKKFSYKLIEAVKGCLFSKYDLKDPYKNVPARSEDWRAYRVSGFNWQGRLFFESVKIFGALPSVANFDILGATLAELTVVDAGISRHLESRALDDNPVLESHGTV